MLPNVAGKLQKRAKDFKEAHPSSKLRMRPPPLAPFPLSRRLRRRAPPAQARALTKRMSRNVVVRIGRQAQKPSSGQIQKVLRAVVTPQALQKLKSSQRKMHRASA